MYSETDFEKLWFLYKTEDHCKGISINVFCSMHGVSYKPFYDWLRKRQKPIVPVQVEGRSCVDTESSDVPTNWSDKGAIQLNKLLPALKSLALQEGSDVNVDETWCRYQTHYGHKKTYMWCLVNRKANIVIFFYEDCTDEDGSKHTGGRRRKVLTDFLGDSNIRSLQSDGYNVYMYLDDELVDMEHLCCMTHARAKFKTAFDQGCDRVHFFLLKMGSLYKREEEYIRLKLPPDEIKRRRNDAYTSRIVDDLWKELYELLCLSEESMSDLMRKALNYLRSFWKQLFRYRTNGEYTIDYFRKLMQELLSGRTDYENLLPQTIGLNSIKK